MFRLIFFIPLVFPLIGISQSDTIYNIDGGKTACTITMVNESSVFFQKDKKSDIEFIEMFYVKSYFKSGKLFAPLSSFQDTIKNTIVNVDGVNINSLSIQYCEIHGYGAAFFNNKIVISIDYGQRVGWGDHSLIKNSSGESINFNSMIDALNFMEKSGWEYINNYVVSNGQSLYYTYLLKRKK